MKDLLRTLVDLPGPCGFEQPVIRYLYERLRDKADECYVDGLGDLIAVRKGAFPGPVLAVSAHADEVGFIVKKIALTPRSSSSKRSSDSSAVMMTAYCCPSRCS